MQIITIVQKILKSINVFVLRDKCVKTESIFLLLKTDDKANKLVSDVESLKFFEYICVFSN